MHAYIHMHIYACMYACVYKYRAANELSMSAQIWMYTNAHLSIHNDTHTSSMPTLYILYTDMYTEQCVLAVKSGVGRYLEFMPLKSSYIYLTNKKNTEGALERVPMNKAEIFQSKTISPIEKRLLMKFIQLCVQQSGIGEASQGSWGVEGVGTSEHEQLGFQRAVGHVGEATATDTGMPSRLLDKTIGELMKEEKLTDTLKLFVTHAIALTHQSAAAEDAVQRVQMYTKSLGRYSDSAFLATYFGVAEVRDIL
jgi:hypothetical protein